ncbi:NAD-dependent epimerase/dehydratase family protein [Plesiocystis pacifica]|nr:NAD-dependent epimerase/dehydratase family protein [Plesiocystis pacifica]
MKRALITGAGGFVGKSIARALLDRGVEVRGFCRGDYPFLREWGVELVRGDVQDRAALEAAVAGCDAVFHAAALVDIWGPYERFFATNVEGTRNVLAACRAAGARKLVYTSTPSVVHGGETVDGVDESAPYPDHFEAHYPATKAIAEREVLAANGAELVTAAIRPHLVWGPGDTSLMPRMIAKARTGRVKLIGEPQPIDTVYIDNAVAAHIAAAERLDPEHPERAPAGKAYFITQGEPMPGPQFLNDLLDINGLPPIEATISAAKARAAAAVIEGLWKLLRIRREPPITRFVVSQMSTAHWYDISAARRELGYEPAVSYAEGMQRLRSWVRDNPL